MSPVSSTLECPSNFISDHLTVSVDSFLGSYNLRYSVKRVERKMRCVSLFLGFFTNFVFFRIFLIFRKKNQKFFMYLSKTEISKILFHVYVSGINIPLECLFVLNRTPSLLMTISMFITNDPPFDTRS